IRRRRERRGGGSAAASCNAGSGGGNGCGWRQGRSPDRDGGGAVKITRNERIAMNGYGIDTRRWIAGTLALAATLTLAACGPDESSGAPREANVVVLAPSDVATAEIQEISGGVVLTGTLNPYRIAEVKAQVPGTVATLNVDRGDAVQSGQTLAVIRAEGIQGQAQGAAAAVAAAEAGLALAQQQLESARVLHEAGAISDLDYRAAQTQHESARAQLASA